MQNNNASKSVNALITVSFVFRLFLKFLIVQFRQGKELGFGLSLNRTTKMFYLRSPSSLRYNSSQSIIAKQNFFFRAIRTERICVARFFISVLENVIFQESVPSAQTGKIANVLGQKLIVQLPFFQSKIAALLRKDVAPVVKKRDSGLGKLYDY